jgi:hypothetical protein
MTSIGSKVPTVGVVRELGVATKLGEVMELGIVPIVIWGTDAPGIVRSGPRQHVSDGPDPPPAPVVSVVGSVVAVVGSVVPVVGSVGEPVEPVLGVDSVRLLEPGRRRPSPLR